jgi:hypothetical protein
MSRPLGSKNQNNIKQGEHHSLTAYEQETIINFNKDEDVAYIFTYEGTWMRHIENRLHIQPYEVNSFGGKWYKVPKRSISKPKAPRTGTKRILSPEHLAKLQASRKTRAVLPLQ